MGERVYDPDNHLFFPDAGPSTPAEYEPAQHMDPAVVADIASWLTTVVDNQISQRKRVRDEQPAGDSGLGVLAVIHPAVAHIWR